MNHPTQRRLDPALLSDLRQLKGDRLLTTEEWLVELAQHFRSVAVKN